MATSDPRQFEPDWTLRPGVLLRSALEDRGLTADVFESAGLDRAAVAALVAGTVRVDLAIAEKIGAALGTTARMWLNAQEMYDADIARGAKDVSEEHLK